MKKIKRKFLFKEIAKLNKIINKYIPFCDKHIEGLKQSLKANQEHNKELNEDLKAHEIVSAEMCELLDFTNSASIADLKSKLVLLNFYTKEECLYKKMTKVKRQLIQSENNLTETTLKLEKNKELQSKIDEIKKVLK